MISETVTRDGRRRELTPRSYVNDNQYIIHRPFNSEHNTEYRAAVARSREWGEHSPYVMLAFYTILSLPFYIAIVGTLVLSLIVYLKSFLCSPDILPKLFYKESTLATHILKRCKFKTRSFSPSPWIKNRHIQTFLPWIIPHNCKCQFDREYLQLRDKGVVALDWVTNINIPMKKKRTVILIIPGLTGDAISVSSLCDAATCRGMQCVVFNRRGHGGTFLTTPKLQSYGDPSDLRQVIKYIHDRCPKTLITVVSFGSGCDLFLSYLGEFGSSAHICAGVCVSPCFEMNQRSSDIFSGIYKIFALLYMKYIIWKHARALSNVINVPGALCSWSLKKFDSHVFLKMFGSEDMDEFYERNNPLRDVDDISVPLIFVCSLDDPVYCTNSIPHDLFKYYPNFFMLTLERGGHCGFREKMASVSWADKISLDYLEAILEFTIKGYRINYQRNPARSTI
ncbi:protein ABHD15-like [Ostrea edulis]|uniref:protein ABHD15-like n=1 Tax=Ostrea edulis TaxID=37623 RepID=UPI0024AE926A|nr:protein ABHD15-like [Ostrea edulis]